MPINHKEAGQLLQSFDFRRLFIEHLGWDKYARTFEETVNNQTYRFQAVAQKRDVVFFVCSAIPDANIRLKLDQMIAKKHFQHLIAFADQSAGRQLWQWARREGSKPLSVRTHPYHVGQSGEALLQKLDRLAVTLEEEEEIAHAHVTGRVRAGFDVEKVTKKFYDRFKTERDKFLNFIEGIPDENLKSWYASVMMNRLMFLYFIQAKSFLNDDADYLRNKLGESRDRKENNYYRGFLTPLFFQGFAVKEDKRDAATNKLLGKIPYLNGGLFQQHEIEQSHGRKIEIADAAFERLFDFFKEYHWHLDERENRNDREINPDVLGYIFEKYINQKQMGAYYTKEDITEYISKNTIIPFLLDAARKSCAVAFEPDGSAWRLLRDNPDRYIHDAVRHGTEHSLPPDIAAGVKDVRKRGGWNRPAPEDFALPTEIWRETVERRRHYEQVRAKLANGEVHEVNDLITLNLNIRQFAQDTIQFCEGPELLRAFYKAISTVSVLDPTCGSGAFLFAALNILKPLYEACLQRMQMFVDELEASPTKHGPKKLEDFRRILDESRQHPKQEYFVLKSIIVGNLYGVDIMEEAVEICKLRLFLKLVAQLEPNDRIEPLPDIDFNIQAGNTLVGYARYEDVQKAVGSRLDFENAMERIEDKAKVLDAAVAQFRAQQTSLNGTVTPEDKQELRRRFAELDEELNDFLSAEYGVKKTGLKAWKQSHKPFHWFSDFHHIMSDGGFDVIIGNPPYVEYKQSSFSYRVNGFQTDECGDLYGYVMERSQNLLKQSARLGLIVPVSLVSTDGFSSLRQILRQNSLASWVSSYAERPSKLFTGVEKRLSIYLLQVGKLCSINQHTSSYHRWTSEERPNLLTNVKYTNLVQHSLVKDTWPKAHTYNEISILSKLVRNRPLHLSMVPLGEHTAYYTRKLRYFIQFFDFIPEIRTKVGKLVPPSELKTLTFGSANDKEVAIALLNSSLFFWFFSTHSDVRNVNRREINDFPCSMERICQHLRLQLVALSKQLMLNFRKNARNITCVYKDYGELKIQSFQPRLSKPIIDEIDTVLARHYGFTDEELDFIINYDIKYRLGAEAEED